MGGGRRGEGGGGGDEREPARQVEWENGRSEGADRSEKAELKAHIELFIQAIAPGVEYSIQHRRKKVLGSYSLKKKKKTAPFPKCERSFMLALMRETFSQE